VLEPDIRGAMERVWSGGVADIVIAVNHTVTIQNCVFRWEIHFSRFAKQEVPRVFEVEARMLPSCLSFARRHCEIQKAFIMRKRMCKDSGFVNKKIITAPNHDTRRGGYPNVMKNVLKKERE
jgi:hypothetical protein